MKGIRGWWGISDLRFEISDFRFQISDFRFQIRLCRPIETKDKDVRRMKYERFEDLPVWNAAMNLAERVLCAHPRPFLCPARRLVRPAPSRRLSVSNNIAEGFERGSTAELLAFLYIARGSAGEVRSMLHFTDRAAEAVHLKSEISDLKSLAESCSRQIRAWADSLQNTDIKGQRHLNDQTRGRYEGKRRADRFQRQIAESLHQAHPDIYPDPNAEE